MSSDDPRHDGPPREGEELRELHQAVAALRQEIESRFGAIPRPAVQPGKWPRQLRDELRAWVAGGEGDAAAQEAALREAMGLYERIGAPRQAERVARELGL